MNKRKFLLLICTLLILTFAMSVANVGADGGTSPIRLSEFPEDQSPLKRGTIVEFIEVDGEMLLKWEEEVEHGFITHLFSLEALEIRLIEFDLMGTIMSELTPRIGDRAKHLYLWDSNKDGTSDQITLHVYQEWSPLGQEFIDLSRQFQQELLSKSLIYTTLPETDECRDESVFTVNYKAIQHGAYKNTYVVPENGGYYRQHMKQFCKWHTPFPFEELAEDGEIITTEIFLRPGETNGWSDDLYKGFSMETTGPWEFCRIFSYDSPVWQPEILSDEAHAACPWLWSKNDDSIGATLSRLGFYEYFGQDHLGDKALYLWNDKNGTDLSDWPTYNWKTVDKIDFGNENRCTVSLGWSDFSRHRDIVCLDDRPLFVIEDYNWGSPVILVPKDKINFPIEWREIDPYRFWIARDGDGVVVQKAIWE